MPLPFLIPLITAAASAIGGAAAAVGTTAAAVGTAVGAAGAAAVGAGAAGLAAVGTAAAGVASAVGAGALGAAALGTLGAVGTGALVLGTGGVALSAAVISHNEEERKRAQARARQEASREKERELQKKAAEYAEKLKTLENTYNISESKKDELRLEASALQGEAEGLILGLRDQGMQPEEGTLEVNKLLSEMREKSGIKKVA